MKNRYKLLLRIVLIILGLASLSIYLIYIFSWGEGIREIDRNTARIRVRQYNYFGVETVWNDNKIANYVEKHGLATKPEDYRPLGGGTSSIFGSYHWNASPGPFIGVGYKMCELFDFVLLDNEQMQKELLNEYLEYLKNDNGEAVSAMEDKLWKIHFKAIEEYQKAEATQPSVEGAMSSEDAGD